MPKPIRTKWWQKWVDVNYGIQSMPVPFNHWSNLIMGFGDEELRSSKGMTKLSRWLWKWRWKKLIVLKPIGPPNEIFKIGYWNKELGICQISMNSDRFISQGQFAMRMGPEDCFFFIISTGPARLELIGFFSRDDPYFKEHPGVVLY